MKRLLLAMGLLLFGAATASAQATTVPPPASTIAFLQQVLQAYYGPANAPTDVVGTATLTRGVQSGPFRFYIKGTQQLRYEFGDGSARSVTTYNQGRGARVTGSKAQAIEAQAAQARASLLPFLDLLSEVGNPALDILYKGAETLEGNTVYHFLLTLRDRTPHVRLLDRSLDEQVDFYVDARTLLVLRSVHYRYAENNLDVRIPSVLDFSDYRIVNGVQVPFRITNTVGSRYLGLTKSVFTLQAVAFNQGIADSLFDAH